MTIAPVRIRTALAALAVSVLALSGCSSSSQTESPAADSSAPAQLSVGVTPIANAASLYLGIDQGFFEAENLTIEPKIIQAAASAIPSLLNNELQFALISPVPTLTAASKGLPVQIALANDHYGEGADYVDAAALIASPGSGAASIADLEGKTIAVVGLKSAPELATRRALENAGVDGGSVKFVEIAYPDMVSALQSDRVDAAVVVDPFLAQAKAAGLATLAQPFVDGLGGQVGTTWVTSTAFTTGSADVAERFHRAMTKAIEYAAANPDEVRRIMGTYTELSDDALANALLPVFDPEVSEKDIQFIADAMLDEGFIETAFDVQDVLWRP